MNEKDVYVYMDWNGSCELVGTLHVSLDRRNEQTSFEFDGKWLEDHPGLFLDPDLKPYPGRQYPGDGKAMFGIFSDSCPDRWGRVLMRRREAKLAREEDRRPKNLFESDYLMGVFDETRMGALRYADELGGRFQAADVELATPPWTSLRELEDAAVSFDGRSGDEERWLRQLLAPGSSLGGARPKANVLAPDGSIWIAKFPSRYDEWNIGAWEMVSHDLAQLCGLDMPEAKLMDLSRYGSTYLVRRFDRDVHGDRIPFMSAMTALGYTDGEDGASYLEIMEFLESQGSPSADMTELWKRVVFNVAIANTDDHLRNHGFLLDGDRWRLSPLYDVNPNVYGDYLSLCIDEVDSTLDFTLAMGIAPEFGIDPAEAWNMIHGIAKTVEQNWEPLARRYGLGRDEIERMRPAFDERQKHIDDVVMVTHGRARNGREETARSERSTSREER